MNRREFVAGLGGAAAWPVVAQAQQPDRVRRIGMLRAFNENDALGRILLSTLVQALADAGWTEGRNLRMDIRWGGGNLGSARTAVKELVASQPDVIFVSSNPLTIAVAQETRTIPIVFMPADPEALIRLGVIASLARPGGNITGFTNLEGSMAGKWVELLTEIAPHLKRAAAIFNPDTVPQQFLPVHEAAARSLKVEPIAVRVRSDAEIEAAITSLARQPGSGLIVMPDNFLNARRAAIASLAIVNKLPTVSFAAGYVRDGYLISYGPEARDLWRRAATYVDRIFRGEKPADLPVQLPTKFETVLNLKTAKSIGLTVAESFLLRADEVIE